MAILVMGFILAIPVSFILLVILACLNSGPLAVVLRSLASIVGLAMMCFFVFGYLASYEIDDSSGLPFRLVYGLFFLLVSSAIIFVWIPRRKAAEIQEDSSPALSENELS
tara:strand:+ start:312 stop:641 length:330 start_codon:yes stop_codon:yes gene_type:complete